MELVELNPYPVTLAIVFNKVQHDQLVQQMDLGTFGNWDEEIKPHATTFTFARKSSPYRLVVVEFYSGNELKYNTISHEGIHVMSSLMEYTGLVYDTNNDEWYAYMHDFIVDAICKAHDSFFGPVKEIKKAIIATGNHPDAFRSQSNEVASVNVLDELNSTPAAGFLDDK